MDYLESVANRQTFERDAHVKDKNALLNAHPCTIDAWLSMVYEQADSPEFIGMRGYLKYVKGDYANAKQDLDEAIRLNRYKPDDEAMEKSALEFFEQCRKRCAALRSSR